MVLNLTSKAVQGTDLSKLGNGLVIWDTLAAGCAEAVVPPGGIKIHNLSAPRVVSQVSTLLLTMHVNHARYC